MFHPTLQLSNIVDNYNSDRLNFDILQVGTGGNGGYLVQRLSKLLYALSKRTHFHFHYTLVDGDAVEDTNLLRQPFIEQDIDLPKSQVLAERYEGAYDIPIMFSDAYIESKEDALKLLNGHCGYYHQHIVVLLGCVDNNATRKLLHDVFNYLPNVIYIDSGIDSIDTEADEESRQEMGYSGQVVCGIKMHNQVYLSPVGVVYPDILTDTDSRLPTQACGETVVYYPQRMQTNEMAALIMNGYLNTLLADHELVSHYTNFNARTNMVRPTYLTTQQLEVMQHA